MPEAGMFRGKGLTWTRWLRPSGWRRSATGPVLPWWRCPWTRLTARLAARVSRLCPFEGHTGGALGAVWRCRPFLALRGVTAPSAAGVHRSAQSLLPARTSYSDSVVRVSPHGTSRFGVPRDVSPVRSLKACPSASIPPQACRLFFPDCAFSVLLRLIHSSRTPRTLSGRPQTPSLSLHR